ncbi:MAG: PIN domain-containing protein [Luteolibacter sp.]
MSDLYLIDSSFWVAVMRKGGSEESKKELAKMLKDKSAAICWPVWVELSQGIRSKKEEEELFELRSLCNWLEFDEQCWMGAAACGRKCIRAGVNVPFGDLLVFACARRYEAELKECDKHFRMIAEVC